MILPVAFICGFAIGWWRAQKRGGTTADKVQYGAAHGIAVSLLALAVTLAADWAGIV